MFSHFTEPQLHLNLFTATGLGVSTVMGICIFPVLDHCEEDFLIFDPPDRLRPRSGSNAPETEDGIRFVV